MSTLFMQISTISSKNSHFPDKLRQIEPLPKSINVLGTLPKGTYVAVVGTRKPTSYGKHVTYLLTRELAQAGAIIVSGLALGIDGIAHRAALDAGGTTVAVLAHGLNQIYPRRHRDLAKEILATGGALVSEYKEGELPLPHHFVHRNRIIAGLSEAVLVTEAGHRSGALITARDALEQGKALMAVPGPITSENSSGPNNLIRKGATPVVSAADIITELGFLAKEAVPVPARSPQEAKILDLLKGNSSATADTLIEASGLSAAEFANIISLMEITGKVRNLGAGLWVAK
jgi:DNA processing protein